MMFSEIASVKFKATLVLRFELASTVAYEKYIEFNLYHNLKHLLPTDHLEIGKFLHPVSYKSATTSQKDKAVYLLEIHVLGMSSKSRKKNN